MKKLYTLLTALLIVYSIQAQELVPVFAQGAGGSDNDQGSGVAVDHKGGVYVVGNFKSASFTLGSTTLINQGNWDAFLAKYDTSGALIWVRQIGNPGKDTATKVLASPDGSIYVALFKDTVFPNTISAVSYPHVYKFNSSGGLVWARSDVRNHQLSVDPQGNLYALTSTMGPVAFRKYSPNGDVLYTREITSETTNSGLGAPYMEPLLSVDWQGQVHLMIHTPASTRLTTNPANNLDRSLSYASRIWYDAAGGLLGTESLSNGIRPKYLYLKARGTNEFAYTYAFATLSGSTTYSWGSRGFGGLGGNTTQCYWAPSSKSADFDRSNAAYFGETYTTPLHTDCMPTPVLPQSTGSDMVFIRTTTLDRSIYSTNIHGNTNERDVTIAVDTAGRYLFAVGSWAKREDTSHFRFGNADLVNGGATGTTDFLFLKFKINNAPLKAKAGFDKRTCPGGYTSLDGSAEGGAGSYSYSWSPAVGLSSATVPNPTVTPDSTREYILTVTDMEGGIARDTVLVTVDSNYFRPTITLVSGANPFCEGSTITLQASGGTNYVWSDGVITGVTGSARLVNKSDTLTVTANGPQGGCVGTSLPYIAVMTPAPALPTINPAGYIVNMCQGSPITLTATHPDPTARFTWSPGGATTSSITVSTPGDYSVRVRVDGNSCISAPGQVNVKTNLPATGSISATGNTTFCEGDSVRLTVSTATGNTILWSNGATTQSIWVKTSGTYSAQVSSPGCTGTTTNSIAVTVKPKPATPIISSSGSTTFCAGGSVTLTASTDISGVSWLWSNGATTQSIIVNGSGTYSVTATADGCSSTSAGTTVTVNPAPTGSISASGSTTFCEGGSVQLSVNTASGNTVLWSNGATTPYITVNTSGTFSAQITSPSGCTITTNSITVTAKPKPATPTVSASGSTTFCSGGNVTLTASTSTSGVNWQWSNGATTPSITVNASGTYTASASLDGCNSTSAGTTVTVNPAPTGSISASGNTTFCEGGNVQLSVSTASGNSILWSNGATTSSITVSTSGTYSAQITSPSGCMITTNSINVTVNPKPSTPTVSASGSTTICSGGSVTLTASTSTSGVSWQWSNGATTSSITVNASGTYTATASINGCSSTSSGTLVTVNPAPTGSISAGGSTSFCEGDSVQLTVSTASGNNILWSNGATSSSIWVKTGGTYSVQLTSAQGCTANTNSISTTVLQRPSPVIGQSGNELSVSPAASAYQWYLNGTAISGATGQSLTISQGGDYSVVVTGSNGCTATAYHSAVFRVNTSFIDYQAYPNPVTADLRLAYTLKEGGQVTFTIVDDQGRQKMVIPVGHQAPGDHQYTIRNAAMRLGTGFYLLKISVGDKQVVHRIVVL